MSFPAAFVLIAIGIIAIYVEFFVPAFGLIGIGGILTIILTVVFSYRDLADYQATIVLVTAILVTPTMILFLLRRFPDSFIGRKLILQTQLNQAPPAQNTGEGTPGGDLTGKPGTAETPLHPSGTALIDGSRYSVVTNGEFLEKGTPITVLQQFGTRIVVARTSHRNDSPGDRVVDEGVDRAGRTGNEARKRTESENDNPKGDSHGN